MSQLQTKIKHQNVINCQWQASASTWNIKAELFISTQSWANAVSSWHNHSCKFRVKHSLPFGICLQPANATPLTKYLRVRFPLFQYKLQPRKHLENVYDAIREYERTHFPRTLPSLTRINTSGLEIRVHYCLYHDHVRWYHRRNNWTLSNIISN